MACRALEFRKASPAVHSVVSVVLIIHTATAVCFIVSVCKHQKAVAVLLVLTFGCLQSRAGRQCRATFQVKTSESWQKKGTV